MIINSIFSTDLDIGVTKILGTISYINMYMTNSSTLQEIIEFESGIYDDDHMEYFSSWLQKYGCRDIGRTSFLYPTLFVTNKYEIKYIAFSFEEEKKSFSFNVDQTDYSLFFLLRGFIINKQYIIAEHRKRLFLIPMNIPIDQIKYYTYYRNPVSDDIDLEEYNKLLTFL